MKSAPFKPVAKTAASIALIIAARSAVADSSVSYIGGVYTQNFNSLATYDPNALTWANNVTTPVNVFPTTPVQINNFVNGVNNTNGYTPVNLTGPSADFFGSIQTISTMTGWYAVNFGGNSSPLTYTVDDGTNGTAALTAFFNPNDAGNLSGNPAMSNLALGATTASGSGNVEFGVKLVNNTTTNLNAISLSYLGELFHQDGGQKTITFGYTIANATTSIPTSGLTAFGGLNVGGFATGATGSTFQIQGPSPSVTNLPLSANWTPGSALWLTWTINSAGGGQGLAIDDLSFSAANLAALSSLTWNLPGSGTWDTSSPNWAGTSSTFSNGNFNVQFGNIANDATITVGGTGVTVAASVIISNSAHTYTFAGGQIGGVAASLIINGGGTVKLTAPNNYGFATNVFHGTLLFDNNNELGASSAALNLQGGIIRLAGNVSAGTRVLSVNASGGTFDTAGFVASFGASTSSLPQIQGVLDVTGGGTLNLGVAPVFGNASARLGHLVVEAGTTVLILGNGRSSPTDMWDGGIINGTLVLQTTPIVGTVTTGTGGRYNFESATANGATHLIGTGVIQIPTGSKWLNVGTASKPKGQLDGSGAIISNTSGSFAAEIDVNIQLNSLEGTDASHPTFVRTDVTSPHAFDGTSTAGNFITVIGGTKKTNNGIGPDFSLMTIGGVISGDSDISVGNDYKSGGSGNLILTAHNTYHGATMLNGGGASLPVLYLGINDALPTDTDLVFGSINGAVAPSLDLNGFDQTIRSLCVGQVTNSPQLNQINNSGLTPATLTISGAVTPFTIYNGQINDYGPTGTDPTGVVNATGGSTTALVKMGSSTLVLGQYLDNQAGGHFTLSTYSGGTTVKGGVLQIPFDGAPGAANGALNFDGGTVAVVTPDLKYDLEQTVTWTSSRPITVTTNGGTINTPTFTVRDSASGSHNLVASVIFTGNGGYNWGGSLQLTGAVGSNVTINGGTSSVTITGTPAIAIAPTVSLNLGGDSDPATDSVNSTKHLSFVNNGLLQISGGNKFLGTVSGAGTLSQSGPGTTTLAGYTATGAINVSAGKLVLAPTSAPRQTSAILLSTASLSIVNSGSALDLTNHDLMITNNTPASSNTLINTLWKNGTASLTGQGDPNGPQITSSTANNNTSSFPTYLVAFDIDRVFGGGVTGDGSGAGNSLGAYTDNQVVTQPGTVMFKYGYYADIDFSGKVDAGDINLVLGSLGSTTPGSADPGLSYLLGDVDLSGKVDAGDINLVLGMLGAGNGGTGGSPLATLNSPANVPEPSSLVLLGLSSVVLLSGKRRKVRAS